MGKINRTNNDLQNTTKKTKDQVILTHKKQGFTQVLRKGRQFLLH